MSNTARYKSRRDYEEEAYSWLNQLRNDYLPAQFQRSLVFFWEKLEKGNFNLDHFGVTKAELEQLRIEKHINSAIMTLEMIEKGGYPPGDPLYDFHMKQVDEDMREGRFTEAELRKRVKSRRTTDPLNTLPTAQKIRNFPRIPQQGTPEYQAVLERTLGFKEIGIACVTRMRTRKLNEADFCFELRKFRNALRAGFTDAQLNGGTFFLAQDFGTSRAELSDLDPREKKQKK